MTNPLYAFDSTGTLSANLITNETHNVVISNGINAYLIVPNAAPFYGNTMLVINSSGGVLTQGVDYFLVLPWGQGSTSTGQPVFGAICLVPSYPLNIYTLRYQTMGGEYVINTLNTITSGIVASYEQYITLDWSTAPAAFPASPHTEMLSGISGMTQVYQMLNNIANAIMQPTAGVTYNDVKDLDLVYVTSTLTPILNLVNSIGLNGLADSALLASILQTIAPLQSNNALPTNLQNYSIPLFGNLILKVGYSTFTYGSAPSSISFPTPNFPNQCLFCDVKVSFLNPLSALVADTVLVGAPTVSGVNISVTYGSSNNGQRRLSYFAIGN